MKFEMVARNLDVQPMLQSIQPEMWGEITTRQTYPGSAHHDTEAIFLRWCPGQTVQDAFTQLEAIDYPASKSVNMSLLNDFLKYVPHRQVGRVMLAKLKSGGAIDRHIDEGAYSDHFQRYHVVLQSDRGNQFYVDEAPFWAVPGEAWWFDHKREHWVENQSSRDRIHLIVDLR